MRRQLMAFLWKCMLAWQPPRGTHVLVLEGQSTLLLKLRMTNGHKVVALADGNIENPDVFIQDVRRFGSLRPNANGTGAIRQRLVELFQFMNRRFPGRYPATINLMQDSEMLTWELRLLLGLERDYGFYLRDGELEASFDRMVPEMDMHVRTMRVNASSEMFQ